MRRNGIIFAVVFLGGVVAVVLAINLFEVEASVVWRLSMGSEGVLTRRKGSRRNCAKEDSILEELKKVLEEDSGPILVGGIGDSGTRGVQILLAHLGVDLGYRNFPGIEDSVSRTDDSLVFMHKVQTWTCNAGKMIMVNAHDIYAAGIEKSHSLSYNERTFDKSELWGLGRQFAANVTLQMYNAVRKDAMIDHNLHSSMLYGFKHPRTSLVLPLFHDVLGRKFRFVHVLRDGRDVANGSNRKMFHALCSDYFNRKCENSLSDELKFWAALNLEVYHWAQKNLHPWQYHLIRIEDIVDGRKQCLHQLSQFLGLPDEHFYERVTDKFLENEFATHQMTYSGRKWSAEQSRRFSKFASKIPEVAVAFETFGYDLGSTERPWKRNDIC